MVNARCVAIVVAAVLAGPAAAFADRLSVAEGTQEGNKVRVVAGEVDDRGYVLVEHYEGERLRYAVPYTRVHVHEEEISVRTLRAIELSPRQTEHGFAFTAVEGSTPVTCTVLLWADATIACDRGMGWVPPGEAVCADAFKSRDQRFQCNGLRTHFTTPTVPHDEVLETCSRAFRWEFLRSKCQMYGYTTFPGFRETLAACVAAYKTEHERDFCVFFTRAPAQPADRITVEQIRRCTGRFADDRATTACVFRLHSGGVADGPAKVEVPERKGGALPTDHPTAPVRVTKAAVEDGVEVATGRWQDRDLRVTAGFVDGESVMFTDAFSGTGEHSWMQPIDRLVIGKETRALREVTALGKLRVSGDVITFRATIAGKARSCRADAASMFARCR